MAPGKSSSNKENKTVPIELRQLQEYQTVDNRSKSVMGYLCTNERYTSKKSRSVSKTQPDNRNNNTQLQAMNRINRQKTTARLRKTT